MPSPLVGMVGVLVEVGLPSVWERTLSYGQNLLDSAATTRTQSGTNPPQGISSSVLGVERLVSYRRAPSAGTAPCTSRWMCCLTHGASHCALCQPLLRAFPAWIRSPPPSRVWEPGFEGRRFRAKEEQLQRCEELLPGRPGQNLA